MDNPHKEICCSTNHKKNRHLRAKYLQRLERQHRTRPILIVDWWTKHMKETSSQVVIFSPLSMEAIRWKQRNLIRATHCSLRTSINQHLSLCRIQRQSRCLRSKSRGSVERTPNVRATHRRTRNSTLALVPHFQPQDRPRRCRHTSSIHWALSTTMEVMAPSLASLATITTTLCFLKSTWPPATSCSNHRWVAIWTPPNSAHSASWR